MAGAEIRVEMADLTRFIASLDPPGHELRDLTELLASEMESQTRRRIQVEKTAPTGEPWEPWSLNYAMTRHANHSLLRDRGGLLDSIVTQTDLLGATVGSNLTYAATHQFGSGDVPARPYLGISDENAVDLEQLAAVWLDDYVARTSPKPGKGKKRGRK